VKYNHEWLGELKFQEITHLLGHFTVQQMMERDMFEKRMKEGKPIAMSEFLYPLMQAYDSAFMDVDAEIGGNDQLFNMLCGRTLQTAQNRRDKFVLTTKLIEGTDGRKMSKTFDNCIWLEDTAKDMYGKVLSIKDELITTYMECTTDIPMDEIKEVEKQMKKGANPKEFKMRLARELVTMYHSEKDAQEQEEEWTRVFSNKELPTDIPEAKATKGALLIDVLIENGLIPSKSEARRLVEQNGITLNDETVSSTDQEVAEGIVKVGKRKFLKITL
jgi:tyrosyl-tRNA synthetase